MAKAVNHIPGSPRRRAPATTLEDREQQLIGAAVELAEKQIRDGTASSQIITHYLKLGSTTAILQNEKLKEENKLLRAKTEAIESSKNMGELFAEAIKAMREYNGED